MFRSDILLVVVVSGSCLTAQAPPSSPDRPWHSSNREVFSDAPHSSRGFKIDDEHIYSLSELIDLAESHNPETRAAWEISKAQAAALGIARSELFPLLVAGALAGVNREEAGLGTRFYRLTVPDFQLSLDLSYTIFDFGARRGRINEERARLLATNFEFNDVHRQLIYEVSLAYYRLLKAEGEEQAADASLNNAQAVEKASEERLRNGLATLPDVLEARSATAQARFDLQAAIGAEQIARGDLATDLTLPAKTRIHVEPLNDLANPDSALDTVDAAVERALQQRPDLQALAAQIREARAERQQSQAAFYPSLKVEASPAVQSLFLRQQTLPWGYTTDLTGGVTFSLTWTAFDGGARRNRLVEASAHIRAAEAKLAASRDQIEDQVWTSYTNLTTAFRQREAAAALLAASEQSYSAALESYNYGVRNVLDVTNAQKVLAQARSYDILARTQILSAFADLAFRTGDSIRTSERTKHP